MYGHQALDRNAEFEQFPLAFFGNLSVIVRMVVEYFVSQNLGTLKNDLRGIKSKNTDMSSVQMLKKNNITVNPRFSSCC